VRSNPPPEDAGPFARVRAQREGLADAGVGAPDGLGVRLKSPPRAPRPWVTRAVLLEAVLDLPACSVSVVGLAPRDASRLIALVQDLLEIAVGAGAVPVSVGDLDLLLAWEVAGERMAPVLERAFACATAMGGRVGREPHGDGRPVELRCGLVGGQVSLGAYGGLAGRWLPVLCGQPLTELCGLIAPCGPGEVAVGATAAAAWLAHPDGRPGGAGRLLLTLDSAPAPVTGPQAVQKVPQGRDGSLALVELLGIEPGRSDHARRLQAGVRALQRVARIRGGTLEEVRQDHRGLCAWVAFGEGGHGRKRAALQALRFGLEVGSELADRGIEAPVGVASGEIVSWELAEVPGRPRVGPAARRASLQVRATASGVVCDAATARRVGQEATLVEIPEPVTPGVADGARFRVDQVRGAERPIEPPETAMVGRAEELTRALLVLEEFEAGGSAVLVVEGAQGMGKSLLVGEIVQRLAGRFKTVVSVSGCSGPAAEPRARWWEALLAGLGLDPHAPRAQLAAQVEPMLAAAGIAVESSAVAALVLAGGEGVSWTGEPENAAGALAREIAVLLGGGPLVLVVEDAQWLDSASWSLLRELFDAVERLLLVVANRTGPVQAPVERQRLEVIPEATVVSLRALPALGLAAMVARELGLGTAPASLVRWLTRASGGNPGLCLEWLRTLREEGLVEVGVGGACAFHQERLGATEPTGSGPLLARRIARLDPDTLRTLEVARRVGSPFSTALAVAAHPDQPGRLRVERDLEHLRVVGLLQAAPGPGTETWRLAQDLPGASTSGTVTAQQAREIHARAAAWLQRQADDLGRLYATLAHHWRAAGDDERAVGFLELAGAEAHHLGAMREACEHFQLALRIADTRPEVATDPIRRAHWERSLGEARYACGELDRCTVHFRRALALLDRPLPATRAGLLVDVVRQILGWLFSPGLKYAAAGLDAKELSRLHEASHAAERLAERFYYSASLLEMVAASTRSANLARSMGARGRNGRPFASFGVLAGLCGLRRYTRGLHEHALRVGREARDADSVVVTLYTRAAYHVGRCEWQEGVVLADEAVAVATAAAAWQEGGVAHTMQGLASYFQGAFTAAEASYLSLLERAQRFDNAQHEAWALFGLGQVQLQTGRLHEAVRSVLQALALLRNLDDYPSRLICQGLLASAYLRQGRRDEALEAAELGWSAALQVAWPFVLSTLDGYRGVVEVFLDAWQREQAGGREFPLLAQRARRAIRMLGRFALIFSLGRPHWFLARARAAAIEGRTGRARALGGSALRQAEALGMSPEIGAAQAFLARHAGLPAAECAALEAQAAESFSSAGCLWHLEELRRGQQGQSQ